MEWMIISELAHICTQLLVARPEIHIGAGTRPAVDPVGVYYTNKFIAQIVHRRENALLPHRRAKLALDSMCPHSQKSTEKYKICIFIFVLPYNFCSPTLLTHHHLPSLTPALLHSKTAN